MIENSVDPYQPPAQLSNEQDEKVIELLLRYKRKLKVVNMLRQEGLSHNDAMSIVNHHTPIAQSIINRKHIGWRITGGFLFVVAIFIVAAMAHYGIFGFFPVLILVLVSYGSYFCVQRRDLIM